MNSELEPHIVVKPHHDGFKAMHDDPRTGEPWTMTTATDYRTKSAGRPRAGGIGCDITWCSCDNPARTHHTTTRGGAR